jgi:hypothetical protein
MKKSEIKSYIEQDFELIDVEFLENGDVHISTRLDMRKDIEDSLITSLCRHFHQHKDGLYGMTVTDEREYVTESIRRDGESTMYVCFSKEPEGMPPYVYYYGCLIGGKPNQLVDARDKLESMGRFEREEFIDTVWDCVDTVLFSKETLYNEVELPDTITNNQEDSSDSDGFSVFDV